MKLLALNCPQCQQPLTPENDHIVTLCQECLTAVQIGEEGVSPVQIHYVATPDGAVSSAWQPFWIFRGQVRLLKRETQSGHKSGGQAARAFWGQPRAFFVPAWDLALSTAQDIGCKMLQQQPVFEAGPQPPHPKLLPVVVTPDDAIKLLEFIVLAIEARRDDWLRDLDFQLEVQPPELWAWPQ